MTKVERNQGDFVLLLFISLYCVLQIPSAKIAGKCGAAMPNRNQLQKHVAQCSDSHRGARNQYCKRENSRDPGHARKRMTLPLKDWAPAKASGTQFEDSEAPVENR